MTSQTTLVKFLNEIEEKQIPPEKWKINPDSIMEGYNHKQIDKLTAIYILKELFYQEKKWSTIEYRNKCIEHIVQISKKDKELCSYLEEIFITEYWYPIRLYALSQLSMYFYEKAFSLFNYILNEETYISFLKYVLETASYKDTSFLLNLINDPLLKLYLYLKKEQEIVSLKINIQKREISYYSTKIMMGNQKKEFRRSKSLIQYTEKEILKQPIKAFIYKKRTEDGTLFETDPDNTFPNLLLYQERKGKLTYNYGISLVFIKALIKAIRKAFNLKALPDFQIIKTTIMYLLLYIEDIQLYFIDRLSGYITEV